MSLSLRLSVCSSLVLPYKDVQEKIIKLLKFNSYLGCCKTFGDCTGHPWSSKPNSGFSRILDKRTETGLRNYQFVN